MLATVTARSRLPQRNDAPDAFLRQTRIAAAVAVLLVIAAVTSDELDSSLWARHAMITGLVASLLIIAISGAVFNEVVERRDRRRWSIVAQYVLFDLVRTARAVWTGMLDLAQLSDPAGPDAAAALANGRALVADRARLSDAVAGVVADPHRREVLQRAVATVARHSNEVLGRWADVMLGATAYTEVLDRHVELYSRVAWLDGLLGHYEPVDDDPRRRRLSRANPAVEMQQNFDDDALRDMVVAIIVLAESLDRQTLELAMDLVPLDWWQERIRDHAATPSTH